MARSKANDYDGHINNDVAPGGSSEASAESLAFNGRSFGEVALRMMGSKNSKVLKENLMIRIEETPYHALQFTMALGWLLEIIVSSISILNLQADTEDKKQELGRLNEELDLLLKNDKVIKCLHRQRDLFLGILNNYPDSDIIIRVCKLIGDYDRVMQCHINCGQYDSCLSVLKSAKKDEFYYKYGHILMKHKPRELVDALMEQKTLQPDKLIPILIQENPYFNKCSETIRYLEHCIKNTKIKSKVVYDYLFELYARHRDEETLINYLEQQCGGVSGSNLEHQCYLDLQTCLRLCHELKLTRTFIVVYSHMGLYDEAVNLASDFDIGLAKSIVKQVHSEDHQKRLWLLIAENTLKKKPNIQIATSLLQESRLLQIEDILPFFANSTKIDSFKEAIRKSLQEYKSLISSLKDGTYDSIANDIISEIKVFEKRYSIIRSGQRCEICLKNIMTRRFHVYPCGHLFHTYCMLEETKMVDSSFTLDANNDMGECIYCGRFLASYIDRPAPINNDPFLTDS